jgi:putative component of membrane protein insertase Oxa1/YidC/SpoIIIJ protein YidD
MAINCCYGCVPPKRTPTCKFDGTCNKYAEEKKKHDAQKAEADKRKRIEYGLDSQCACSVHRAYKTYRKKG